jgi:hypothetical protein
MDELPTSVLPPLPQAHTWNFIAAQSSELVGDRVLLLQTYLEFSPSLLPALPLPLLSVSIPC